MSTLAEEEPLRAIENALDRLERAAEGTPLAAHVDEEREIIMAALETLGGQYGFSVPPCGCGPDGPCDEHGVFGIRGS